MATKTIYLDNDALTGKDIWLYPDRSHVNPTLTYELFGVTSEGLSVDGTSMGSSWTTGGVSAGGTDLSGDLTSTWALAGPVVEGAALEGGARLDWTLGGLSVDGGDLHGAVSSTWALGAHVADGAEAVGGVAVVFTPAAGALDHGHDLSGNWLMEWPLAGTLVGGYGLAGDVRAVKSVPSLKIGSGVRRPTDDVRSPSIPARSHIRNVKPLSTPQDTTVGLALIARNEEHQIGRLLESCAGAFDRVVLVDTGSTDRTIELFEQWAAGEQTDGTGFTWEVAHHQWADDFTAPRALADSLLRTDWTVWADCDDTITHPQVLRVLAANAPAQVSAYVFDYDYAHDEHRNVVCVLRRERLVRAGHGTWTGRVHEAQLLAGPVQHVAPDVCKWVHQKSQEDIPKSNPRNLRILRGWNREEPDNPRVLAYLGTELAAQGKHKQAVGYYRRYLKLTPGWDEERAQVHRKLAASLMVLDRAHDARDVALEALKVLPAWTDSYLTLAQTSYMLGEYPKAIQWATRCLELGAPETLLIVNPLDYVFEPRLVLAAAHEALGDPKTAIAIGSEALRQIPNHPVLYAVVHRCQARVKRDQTAEMFVGMARLLCEHDEQLKALRLLEDQVPHYAIDHAAVVAERSMLRERVRPLLSPVGMAEHYLEATEIGLPDLAVVEQLPRAHFLARGIVEQHQEQVAA